jgi:hypothetical protein
VLFHIATDGRVQLDPDAVNALFCKREKRQAAEWLLDEEELSKFGVTATHLAQIFEGPPSVSPTGYPRGTPLAIPTDGRRRGEDVRVGGGGEPSGPASRPGAPAPAAPLGPSRLAPSRPVRASRAPRAPHVRRRRFRSPRPLRNRAT